MIVVVAVRRRRTRSFRVIAVDSEEDLDGQTTVVGLEDPDPWPGPEDSISSRHETRGINQIGLVQNDQVATGDLPHQIRFVVGT